MKSVSAGRSASSTGEVIRRTRRGREKVQTLWSRVPPALQLLQVFRAAIGQRDAPHEQRRHRHQVYCRCLWLIKASYDFEQIVR